MIQEELFLSALIQKGLIIKQMPIRFYKKQRIWKKELRM